jgi:hypothetical protein
MNLSVGLLHIYKFRNFKVSLVQFKNWLSADAQLNQVFPIFRGQVVALCTIISFEGSVFIASAIWQVMKRAEQWGTLSNFLLPEP